MSTNATALLDTIRRVVRDELRGVHTARLAIVQEVHPHASDDDDDGYSATVALHDSELVLTRVSVASARTGIASIPAVGDMVLVQFVNGDVHQPIVVGSLYNDEDRPPVNAEGEWVLQLPPAAGDDEGLRVVASSTGTPSFEIRIGASLLLTLKDDDPVVSLDVGDGAATLSIDSDGTVSLTSSRDLIIEAGMNLELKGQTVKTEGAAEVAIKGGVIKLN